MLMRRISGLWCTASLFKLTASRSSIIPDSYRSGRQAAEAIPSAPSSSPLGLGVRLPLFHGVGIVVRTWNVGLFPVVSRQTSPWPRSTLTSTSGQTPRTCGGGSPPDRNRFRPLVSGGSSVVHQRKGAPCGGARSTVLSSLSSQLHGSDLFG